MTIQLLNPKSHLDPQIKNLKNLYFSNSFERSKSIYQISAKISPNLKINSRNILPIHHPQLFKPQLNPKDSILHPIITFGKPIKPKDKFSQFN